MNNKLVLALLTTIITYTNAQIASLKELAAQKYSNNLPRILQDLQESKLNLNIQNIIKKQLINRFSSSKTLTFPFTIRSISFHPSGQYVSVVPDDNQNTNSTYNSSMVMLVNLDNLAEQRRIVLHHDRPIHKTVFSPNGKYILTSQNDCIYIHTITNPQIPLATCSNNNILSADFSPDGTLLILRHNKAIFLYTIANFQAPPIILDHTTTLANSFDESHILTQVACSPDGKHILTGSSKGLLYLWDITNPQQPPKILGDDGYYTLLAAHLLGHHGYITSIAFSKCGRYVLTGSLDRTARFWDTAHPQTAPCIFYHDSPVHAVALSHCGKHALITGLYSDKAYLWNIHDKVEPITLKNDNTNIFTVAFSKCGKYAITAECIGKHQSVLRFWDLATCRTNYTLENIIKKFTNNQ